MASEVADRISARPYCCSTMKHYVERRCLTHPDRFDCPDSVVVYVPRYDEFGLVIRDQEGGRGNSYVTIAYCPWCGSRLPESKRDRWFAELEKRGLDPAQGELPGEFLTGAWWFSAERRRGS